jgi:hypothetical protein
MKYLDVNQDKVIDTLKIADWRIQKNAINIIGLLIQALICISDIMYVKFIVFPICRPYVHCNHLHFL